MSEHSMSSFKSRRPLFAILAVVNLGGIFAAIFMPFLPSRSALLFALLCSGGCLAAMLGHARQGFRESTVDKSLAMEFESAGIATRPFFAIAVLSLLFGIFGFFTASYLLAGGYTRLLGSPHVQRFTVASSSWSNSRKFGRCYETRFSEQPAAFQVFRSLCLPVGLSVGEAVVVRGYSTWLGIYVEGVQREGILNNPP